MKQLNALLVIGLSVLFGRNSCAPQPQAFGQANSSKYVLGEQSSGKVGKVEVSSSSASSIDVLNANFGVSTFQSQQQQFQQPQVISRPQPQPVQQVAPQYASNQYQRLQSVNMYQQAQSQYERELAQYRQTLQAYQQQTAAAQQEIQARVYQQPQYVYQPPVQQQQYYQPVQQQPFYQSYTPYPQYDFYSRMSFESPRRTSSSSSLFNGFTSGLRSVTSAFGLGFGILG